MHLSRRIRIQLALFMAVTLGAFGVLGFGYLNAPATWLGVGRYTVIVELPDAAGLYATGNVSYRGTNVGRVTDVRLGASGVEAVLSLRTDVPIPSDLDAAVHSVTAIGEQYVALTPRAAAPPLRDGDVIPRDRASVSPDVNTLLESTNRAFEAIPDQNLSVLVDESYRAFGGLGPELARIVEGSTRLAVDARKNLEPLVALIKGTAPVLDTQVDSSAAIQDWSSQMAEIAGQFRDRDEEVAGVLEKIGPSFDELQTLFQRFQPTLPVLMANLVTVGQVAVAYQPALEQLLVLLPPFVEGAQGGIMANGDTKGGYRGLYQSVALNINLPPPCVTGFLPPQQRRNPTLVDYPDRPEGDLYCRTPQDSPFNVRGAKNYPCLTVPGKRAPSVKMCESDQQYVPLNDGYNWKGDPNATMSGQDVPQVHHATPDPPESPELPLPRLPIAEYDPATGTYLAPDGREYTQSNLAETGPAEKSWQSMLVPPGT
ncbi:MCE family protein [Mycolicibacterium austroafricanum]|uniref:MCE family protein n=1 Tax=Mycolicibacterium austroafricanum TaxID=39687 RepID=UPI001CA32E50|nr:MlaD family protein [Mycolicibacterium austroafricanum]QZT55541.1 MCE family protein [Mycolicibacterium austroafricanum]